MLFPVNKADGDALELFFASRGDTDNPFTGQAMREKLTFFAVPC